VESHEFGKRGVHVDDVVHIPLDEPAQVALSRSHRSERGAHARQSEYRPLFAIATIE
jgi:hypothetical protein